MIRLEPKIEVKISPDNKVYISWTWLVNGEEDWLKAVSEVFTYLTQEEINHEYAKWSIYTFSAGTELTMDEFNLRWAEEKMTAHKLKIEEFLRRLHRLNIYKKLVLEKLRGIKPVEVKLNIEEEIKDYAKERFGLNVKSVELCVDKPTKITETEDGLMLRTNPFNYQYAVPIALERIRLGMPFPEPEEDDYANEPLYFAWSLKSYIKRNNIEPVKFLKELDKYFSDELGLYLVQADYGLVKPLDDDDDYWMEYKEVEI